MNTKALDRIPLIPGAVLLVIGLSIWSVHQQYTSAPEIPAPAIKAPPLSVPPVATPAIPVLEITVQEALTAIGKGAVVIDVRDRGSYAEGHIAGAISMPLDELKRRAPELAAATHQEYIVYCGNGSNLGPQAARAMSAAGHTGTRNLPAGYSGWKAAGQATATGAK